MAYKKIILNVPHASDKFPKKEKSRYINQRKLKKDINFYTDWFLDKVFSPKTNKKHIAVLIYKYSRFYCDVERLINDPLESRGEGIVYTKNREISNKEIEKIKNKEYFPYRKKLSDLIEEDSIIIDCHSHSQSPKDPYKNVDICIGFNEDSSKPPKEIIEEIKHIFSSKNFSVGINVPFSNAIIGNPGSKRHHSMMIELNKRVYMDKSLKKINKSKLKKINSLLNEVYLKLLSK